MTTSQGRRRSFRLRPTPYNPPFEPSRYFRELPTLNLTALQHMTRRVDVDDLVAFAADNDLTSVTPQLTIPVRVFHGGRDRTIPVDDGVRLAASVAGPSVATILVRRSNMRRRVADQIL